VEIGIRPGEKLHEEMITKTDALNTIDLGRYYAILPSISDRISNEDYIRHHSGKYLSEDFHYSSDKNTEWETTESMQENIKRFFNPDFVTY
jgi:FlaA1/EpsC-like NDP-sugar epimerase